MIEHNEQGIERGKEQGNKLLSEGSTGDALQWYTKCIELTVSEKVAVPKTKISILFSNRAVAHANLKNWEEVVDDCTSALLLDKRNFKAKFRRAKALSQLGENKAAYKDLWELPEMPGALKKEVERLKQTVTKLLQQEQSCSSSSSSSEG